MHEEFDKAVLDQIMFTVVKKINSVEKVCIEANVAHGHQIIQKAVQIAQKMPAFASDDTVQRLKFARPWVKDFLRRCVLRRRRTTQRSSEKAI